MKKILFLCVPLLLISGCSATEKMFGQTAPDFDTSYNVKAEIDYGNFSACADITRNDADNWDFRFTDPEYLNGIALSLNEDEVTVNLGELNISTEKNDFYRLVPDLIAESVNSLAGIDKENITEQDGVLSINMTVADKKVVITADKDGNLLKLKCPYYNISVDFNEQTPIAYHSSEDDEFVDPQLPD